MRLSQVLILLAFIIGLAHCADFVIPEATAVAIQPGQTAGQTAGPAQGTTTSEKESALALTQGQLGPILPNILPAKAQIQARDLASNDYKCGPKWGKCQGGTCCSSAGQSDRFP